MSETIKSDECDCGERHSRSQQRMVRWPIFWLVWSVAFGTFAATMWATGTGTPTLQAAAAGFHFAAVLFLAEKVLKAI